MKCPRPKVLAAGLLAALAVGSAAAADVGISVSIAQPGVYGRIDIGQFPQPALVVPQPVVVAPAPVVAAPMYLWVPEAHRLHWARYCGRYNACGAPVYFVQDGWYREHVVRAHERREDRREAWHDERRDDRWDDHHSHGRGHGAR